MLLNERRRLDNINRVTDQAIDQAFVARQSLNQ